MGRFHSLEHCLDEVSHRTSTTSARRRGSIRPAPRDGLPGLCLSPASQGYERSEGAGGDGGDRQARRKPVRRRLRLCGLASALGARAARLESRCRAGDQASMVPLESISKRRSAGALRARDWGRPCRRRGRRAPLDRRNRCHPQGHAGNPRLRLERLDRRAVGGGRRADCMG